MKTALLAMFVLCLVAPAYGRSPAMALACALAASTVGAAAKLLIGAVFDATDDE